METRAIINVGSLVWLVKDDETVVGTVLGTVSDEHGEEAVCVQYQNKWILRDLTDLTALTTDEKVLYMLESGKQCK